MALLLAYGIWHTVPNREAVALEREALRAVEVGNFASAERRFAAVLRQEPRSTHARFGLACSFFLTGHRSRAALELTMALEAGLALGPMGDCGHRLSLDRVFLTAKLGLTGAFAVPRVTEAHRYEQMLMDVPTLTDADDAKRLLIGSCLAFRAGLDGAGWYYAASAAELTVLDGAPERRFFRCAGPAIPERLHCGPSPRLDTCVLSDRVRHAYRIEEPYLYE